MVERLSQYMVKRGIIKEEEQELYQFGIRNGVILLLDIVTALLIGLFTGKLALVCVFTISFMVLRSYTNGYHSKSRIFCYIASNLLLFIPVYTVGVWEKVPITIIVTVLMMAVGIILVFSPVDSRTRKMDQSEKEYFGRKAQVIVLIQILFMWGMGKNGLSTYAHGVYMGVCITSVLMIIEKCIIK